MRISRALMARFERLPGERRKQQPARIQQQIAAVGAVQRARLDQQEVGDQRAHLGDVLDASDQIAEGRVLLLDDRRSGARRAVAVRDHHVDHVAPEAHVVRRIDRLLDDGVVFLAGRQEHADVANEIEADGLQVVDGGRHVREGRNQVVHRLDDGGLGHLLVQVLQARAPLLVGLGQALEDGAELPLQGLDLGFDVAPHALRQGVEHLGLDDLALVHRRHGEAGRGAQDGDVLALRLLVQRLERLLVAGAELLVDGAPAHLVVFALEQRRQHVPAARRSRRPCPWPARGPGQAAAAAPWAGWDSRNCRRRPSRTAPGPRRPSDPDAP